MLLDRLRSTLTEAGTKLSRAYDAFRGLVPTVHVSALGEYGFGGGWRSDNGSKFPDGFGPTEILTADYYSKEYCYSSRHRCFNSRICTSSKSTQL